ncbi:MAG: mechanosensitive ion channel [Nitratireductor sp.]|nr:mechanosensitive ion channel [Nitratireductor sp.]
MNQESFLAKMASLEIVWANLAELATQYALSLVGAILLIIVGYILAGVLERWSGRLMRSVRGFDETLVRFLSKAVRYVALILVAIAVLGQFGVQTASIIAALGAAGLAIGLALQGTLQNIAAGIMLMALRPFKVGEYVSAGAISGTIVEIGLFATQLKTIDGLFVFAPNSQLWNTPVTNYTRAEERRFDLAIGIGYEDDIGKAEKILLDIAAAEARVLETPAPATFVSELGDSAVAVNLRCWMKGADWWATSRDLTKRAKLEFDANGISIPFPQRDVHYLPLDKPASGVSTASRGTKPGATRKPKAAAK